MAKYTTECVHHVQIYDKELNELNNNRYIDIQIDGLKIRISRIDMNKNCFDDVI